MVKTTNIVVQKGDVVWVPFRRDPLWPALVQNVYPKKLTYVFFPLLKSNDITPRKNPTFSCHPKAVFALTKYDSIPAKATIELSKAFAAAQEYLKTKGWTKGSAAPQRPSPDGRSSLSQFPANSVEIEDADNYHVFNRGVKQEVSDDGQTPVSSSAGSMEPGELRGSVTVRSRQHSDRNHDSTTIYNRRRFNNNIISRHTTCNPPSRGKRSTRKPSVEHSPTPPAVDPYVELAITVYSDTKNILESIWSSDLIRSYVIPERSSMVMSLHTTMVLNDHDADTLFDNVLDWLKEKEKNSYTLPAVHLATEVLMPEIIIRCLQKVRLISREEARCIVYNQPMPSPTQPTANGVSKCGLEELVRIACRERDSLSEE